MHFTWSHGRRKNPRLVSPQDFNIRSGITSLHAHIISIWLYCHIPVIIVLLINPYILNCFMWAVIVRTTKNISPSIISEGGRLFLQKHTYLSSIYNQLRSQEVANWSWLWSRNIYIKVFNYPSRSRISKCTKLNRSIRRIRGEHMGRTI